MEYITDYPNSEIEVLTKISEKFKIPLNKDTYASNPRFVETAENEWKDFNMFARELIAFTFWYNDTIYSLNNEFKNNFNIPKLEYIAYANRCDLNYAILRYYGGHSIVQKRIRNMKLDMLYHPLYNMGKNKNELLYLEHGSVWLYKALPEPPLLNINKYISNINHKTGQRTIDTTFTSDSLPIENVYNPAKKLITNHRLKDKRKQKMVLIQQ